MVCMFTLRFQAKGIFVGGSGVTTSNGMRILANGNRDLFLGPGEALYGVCNAGTVKTTYLASMNE